MPTYQYRCTDCADEIEVVQRFTDDPLTECPECRGTLRKVFSPVGVVFKGSGFYATDNRTKGKSNAAKSGDSTTESSTPSKDAAPSQATVKHSSAPAKASPAPSSTPAA